MTDATLTLQDIADLAHVRRPVVSMWRRRLRVRGVEIPFPVPMQSADGIERFARDEVVAWLEATGRGNNVETRQDAPALSAPAGINIEAVVVLLCLHALTGEELAGQRMQAEQDNDVLYIYPSRCRQRGCVLTGFNVVLLCLHALTGEELAGQRMQAEQ